MLAGISGVFGQTNLYREGISREYSVSVSPEFEGAISRESTVFIEVGNDTTAAISREHILSNADAAVPAPVTDFEVDVSATGDRIRLDWSAYNPFTISDLGGFRIYISDTEPIFDVTGLTPVGVTDAYTTTFEISGLSQFVDRFIAIVAFDSANNFDPVVSYAAAYVLSPEAVSREYSINLQAADLTQVKSVISREHDLAIAATTPPSPIENFNVDVSPGGDEATLSWSDYDLLAEAPVQRFDIYLSNEGPFLSVSGLTPITSVSGETKAVFLEGLPQGVDHYFAIVPVDALNRFNPSVNYSGAYVISPEAISREFSLAVGTVEIPPSFDAVSREVTFVVPDLAPPFPVTGIDTGFFVETSTEAFGSVVLDFTRYNETAVGDLAAYDVYVAPAFFDNVTGLTPFARLPPGHLRPTLSGLPGGSINHFAVVAVDVLGGFDPSVRSASAQASISGVGEVTELDAFSTATELSFNWAAPENASAFLENYRVRFANEPAVDLPLSQTSFVVSDLNPGQGYPFRISTVDIFGNESSGIFVNSATWLSNPVVLDLNLVGGDVIASWPASQPEPLVANYRVYSSTSSFGDVSSLNPLTETVAPQVNLGSLASVQDRWFAVAVVNIVGGSDPAVMAFEASKQPQTISFPTPVVTGLSIDLNAVATSDLPVRYLSSDSSVAEVNGDTLTILRGGYVSITARQDGDSAFWQAPPVTIDLRPAPVITSFTANDEDLTTGSMLDVIDELLQVTATDRDGIVAAEFFIRPAGGAYQSLGRDSIPGDGFTAVLALDEFAPGSYDLRVQVETPEGIRSERMVPVTLALSPPAAPTFTAPTQGTTVKTETIRLEGTAARDSTVQLFRDGVALGAPINVVDGNFATDVPLQPGPNELTTIAMGAAGSGPESMALVVHLRTVLELKVTPPSVAEGGTTNVQLSRNHAIGAATLRFRESVFGQFVLPPTTTIEDGERSINVVLGAVDDVVPEIDESVTFTALMEGADSASENVLVLDNDRPNLGLSLNRDTISENDLEGNLLATVTRMPVAPAAFVVELENSNPAALETPATVEFPAFTDSIEVPLRVIDDELLDGVETVTLIARYLDVTTQELLASSNPAVIQITDDEGPVIDIDFPRATLPEGRTLFGTVARNTGTTALEVTLVTTPASEIQIPTSVTIPAGQNFVDFAVSLPDNGSLDGDRAINITATAAGFAPDQASLLLTDTSLPDLAVSRVVVPPTAQTEDLVSLTYRIENQGLVSAEGPFDIRVYLSEDSVLDVGDEQLSAFTFDGDVPADLFFERSESLLTPRRAGDYFLLVQVDSFGSVSEIVESNNLAVAGPITIGAAYEAVVATEVEIAPSDTPVPLSGFAINMDGYTPAAFKLVNIHIRVRDTLRTFSALTDSAGGFTLDFDPLPGEGGVYTIEATHPGVEPSLAQDSFTLLGLIAEPDAVEATVTRSEIATTGTFELSNPTDVSLAGISFTPVGLPAGLTFSASLESGLADLAPLGSSIVTWTATADGSALNEVSGVLEINSANGAFKSIPISLTIRDLTSRLDYEGGRLRAGMTPGEASFVNFTVRNEGSVSTGPIRIVLPDTSFLSSVTASPAPPIPAGGSADVTLRLAPPEDIELTEFTGTLLVAGNDNTVSIPFAFRALSDETGNLVVRTENEFTYFAESTPPLADATVVICDAVDGREIARGTTTASGELQFKDLREGFYEIKATAPSHTTFRETVFIENGASNEVRAFLSRQTVEYIWNVVPTEIEDRYTIVVETVFEANVPAPVVTVEPAYIDLEALPNDVNQVNITLTNHGLIAAEDVGIDFSSNDDWDINSLATQLGTLPAKSSITVPLIISRKDDFGDPLRSLSISKSATASAHNTTSRGGSCRPPVVCVDWKFKCGDISVYGTICIGFSKRDNCGAATPRSGEEPGESSSRKPTSSPSPIRGGGVVSCDPCILKVLLTCTGQKCNSPESCAAYYGAGGGVDGEAAKCVVNVLSAGDAAELLYEFIKCGCSALGYTPAKAVSKRYCTVFKCIVETLICLNKLAGDGGRPEGEGGVRSALSGGTNSKSQSIRSGIARNSGTVDIGALAVLEQEAEILLDLAAGDELLFGSLSWFLYFGEADFEEWIETFALFSVADSEGEERVTNAEMGILETLPFAQRGDLVVSPQVFIDRWNRSVDYNKQGIFEVADLPTGANPDFITVSAIRLAADRSAQAIARAESMGFEDVFDPYLEAQDDAFAFLTQGEGVCARVRLRLEQDAVLTRDAFEASLDLINNGVNPLSDAFVEIFISDTDGVDASGLFGVSPVETTNVNGDSVAGESTGTWTWTLIPGQDAAPLGETIYNVEGRLTYVEGGELVTIPLAPQSITVYPNPNLRLKYYHERDVFSDDPFTDIVEPSRPFSLGVIVENTGAGEARNLRIASGQPEIVENDKGLLIDFKVIATEVDGNPLSPSLTADFGNILPGQSKVGRWLMTSTLQGLFIDYEANFTHVDALGDARLSLIESVEIFETIRVIRALGAIDDGLPDFLVNATPDALDLPDAIHFSDGSVAPVTVATEAAVDTPDAQNLSVVLDIPNIGMGWTYLRIPDPGDDAFRLVSCVRSDGRILPLDSNVWVTDRTFIGLGREPLRENNLHLIDEGGNGSYTLTYAPVPAPDTQAPISQMLTLPTASGAFFEVSWEGTDDDRIVRFDIFLSEDGKPFQVWRTATEAGSALFPGVANATYEFYSIARDAAGNVEAPKSTGEVSTVTSLSNQSPVISLIPPLSVGEGDILRFQIQAQDPDGPDSSLRYTVDADHPGITINARTGRLEWRTGEPDGGRNVAVEISVTDGHPQPLSASQSTTIQVAERNALPVLDDLGSFAIDVDQTLTLVLSADDQDLPEQLLRYRFGSHSPAGMVLDPDTGVLSWTPDESSEGQSFEVLIEVFDDQDPEGVGQAILFIDVLRRPGFPPEFDPFPGLVWKTDGVESVFLSGSDAEGEPVTISADLSILSGGWPSLKSDEGAAIFTWETWGVAPGVYLLPVTIATDRQATTAFLEITIEVRETITSYLDWAASFGLDGLDALETAVNNPLGFDNFTAYALGVDPIGGIAPGRPEPGPRTLKNTFGIAFSIPVAESERPNLLYRVERSIDDLASWTIIAEKLPNQEWTAHGVTVNHSILQNNLAEISIEESTIPSSSAFYRLCLERDVLLLGDFNKWMANFTTTQDEPEDDANGDRIPNLLAWSLGHSSPLETNVDERTNLPRVSTAIGEPRYQVNLSNPRQDVRYLIESSSDLSRWEIIAARDGDGSWYGSLPESASVGTYEFELPENERQFLRLRVEPLRREP